MSRPDGAHTHGHGGGGLGLVVVVVLVLAVASKVAHAIGQAADTAGHVLAVVLEVVFITVISAAGLGVLAAVTWAGVLVHRRYADRAAPANRRSLSQPIQALAEVVRKEPRRLWLCEACNWVWPVSDLFCNVCGRGRAVAGTGREVQALDPPRLTVVPGVRQEVGSDKTS